ncbi:MAG TPA: DUF4087 domain-containing protein [Pyrinomonadaceae bacterium]|nr:DUF4087 domain-containing protein [Pyrinomonadaceae bacterium]
MTILRAFALLTVIIIAVVAAARPAESPDSGAAVETRCGWFSNPTPANAWFLDGTAEWTVAIQGGHQAEGDWPSFKSGQWVKTNGNYGYGCACLQLRVDKQSHEVLEIKSSQARPLSQCRRDPALKKWHRKL